MSAGLITRRWDRTREVDAHDGVSPLWQFMRRESAWTLSSAGMDRNAWGLFDRNEGRVQGTQSALRDDVGAGRRFAAISAR